MDKRQTDLSVLCTKDDTESDAYSHLMMRLCIVFYINYTSVC